MAQFAIYDFEWYPVTSVLGPAQDGYDLVELTEEERARVEAAFVEFHAVQGLLVERRFEALVQADAREALEDWEEMYERFDAEIEAVDRSLTRELRRLHAVKRSRVPRRTPPVRCSLH